VPPGHSEKHGISIVKKYVEDASKSKVITIEVTSKSRAYFENWSKSHEKALWKPPIGVLEWLWSEQGFMITLARDVVTVAAAQFLAESLVHILRSLKQPTITIDGTTVKIDRRVIERAIQNRAFETIIPELAKSSRTTLNKSLKVPLSGSKKARKRGNRRRRLRPRSSSR
jgi:hypothetical protein